MKRLDHVVKSVMGMAILFLLLFAQSCAHYYKAVLPPGNSADDVVRNYPDRYFILHVGKLAFFMNNMVLSPDNQSLDCMLLRLPPEHGLHLQNGRGHALRYRAHSKDTLVMKEVHFYISPDVIATPGKSYTLAFEKVLHIEVLEKNKGATTVSYVLGIFGIAAAAFLITAAITLSTLHFME